ncbi:uncharacterized [Tachysurus ichikawai]
MRSSRIALRLLLDDSPHLTKPIEIDVSMQGPVSVLYKHNFTALSSVQNHHHLHHDPQTHPARTQPCLFIIRRSHQDVYSIAKSTAQPSLGHFVQEPNEISGFCLWQWLNRFVQLGQTVARDTRSSSSPQVSPLLRSRRQTLHNDPSLIVGQAGTAQDLNPWS